MKSLTFKPSFFPHMQTEEPGRDHIDSTGSAGGRRSRQVSMISHPGGAVGPEGDGGEPDDDDTYEDIDQEQVDEAVKSGKLHMSSYQMRKLTGHGEIPAGDQLSSIRV